VFNLVVHIKGGTWAEGVAEWGAESDIWVSGGRSYRRLEKTA
jgi:hypothetical protein